MGASLTPDRLQELRRIAEAAVPGKWSGQDFQLAITPRTALALLDEIERLQQKVQRANALAVTVEQSLKAWTMGDSLTPFIDDVRNALLDFEGFVASEGGWLEIAIDDEEGGATDGR